MHTYRVHILHAADRNRVICRIPHHFKFNFLVTTDTLFDQDLMYRGQTESVRSDLPEFLHIVRETAAGTTQSKCRPEHHRIANLFRCLLCFFQGIGDL